LGFKIASCASTGNLANSVAAHAARAGMESVVLIPHDLETAKVTMTSVYGGRVFAVEGSYDDVNRLCAELTSEQPQLLGTELVDRVPLELGRSRVRSWAVDRRGSRSETPIPCSTRPA